MLVLKLINFFYSVKYCFLLFLILVLQVWISALRFLFVNCTVFAFFRKLLLWIQVEIKGCLHWHLELRVASVWVFSIAATVLLATWFWQLRFQLYVLVASVCYVADVVLQLQVLDVTACFLLQRAAVGGFCNVVAVVVLTSRCMEDASRGL